MVHPVRRPRRGPRGAGRVDDRDDPRRDRRGRRRQVVDGDPDVVVTGPAFVDSAGRRAGRAVRRRAGEHVDGHDLRRRGASRPARPPCWAPGRPGCRRVVVDDPVGRARPARRATSSATGCPTPTVVALTGSQGKTSTKDMLAQVLADGRPDGRHGRLVQQRDRGSAHRAAGHAGHPVPGAGDGRARHRPHRLPVRHRAARRRAGAQRRHGAHRRVRQPGGDRGGQGRARRGAAADGVAVLNADDPLVAAMARADRGPGASPSDEAGGATCDSTDVEIDDLGRPTSTFRVRRRRPAPRAPAPGRRAPARQRRRGGRASRVGAGARRSTRSSRRARRAPSACRGGGWRCTSAPTASPSSTTPTTPTRTRCGPRSRPWPRSAAAAARRTIAVLGEMRELGAPAPDEHDAVGGSPSRLGHRRSSSWSGTAPGRIHRRRVAGQGRGPTSRCSSPTSGRGSGMVAREHRRPGTSCWSRRPAGPALERVAARSCSMVGRAGGHAMRAILLAGGLALILTLLGTRFAIRVLSAKGYGQLIRDDGPTTTTPSAARRRWAAWSSSSRVGVGYFGAKLITQDAPSAVGAAAAVPVRRPGHGRVPRRLHQDLQAAQPRPAQQGQDDRPDRDRGGVRLCSRCHVARGRSRGRPRRRSTSRSSATSTWLALPALLVVICDAG